VEVAIGYALKNAAIPEVFNRGSIGFVLFKVAGFPIEDFGNDEFF